MKVIKGYMQPNPRIINPIVSILIWLFTLLTTSRVM